MPWQSPTEAEGSCHSSHKGASVSPPEAAQTPMHVIITMPSHQALTWNTRLSGSIFLLRHITQPRPGYTRPNLWPEALMDATFFRTKSLEQRHKCLQGLNGIGQARS